MHLSKTQIKESYAEIEINPVCVANASGMDDLLSIQNPGFHASKLQIVWDAFKGTDLRMKREKLPSFAGKTQLNKDNCSTNLVWRLCILSSLFFTFLSPEITVQECQFSLQQNFIIITVFLNVF